MAVPFPTLGTPDACGHRGMFIGENHNRPDTVSRVLELWPHVSAKIDIMFLEAFDAGVTPNTSSRKAVLAELERATKVKAWEWEYDSNRVWVAPAYRAMGALAQRTGTELRGIDLYPHPWWTRHTHFEKYRIMTFQFRTQPGLHEAWATVVRDQLLGAKKFRFAVLAGSRHGPELKKVMPGLILFTLDKQGELREYASVAQNNEPVFVS